MPFGCCILSVPVENKISVTKECCVTPVYSTLNFKGKVLRPSSTHNIYTQPLYKHTTILLHLMESLNSRFTKYARCVTFTAMVETVTPTVT